MALGRGLHSELSQALPITPPPPCGNLGGKPRILPTPPPFSILIIFSEIHCLANAQVNRELERIRIVIPHAVLGTSQFPGLTRSLFSSESVVTAQTGRGGWVGVQATCPQCHPRTRGSGYGRLCSKVRCRLVLPGEAQAEALSLGRSCPLSLALAGTQPGSRAPCQWAPEACPSRKARPGV